MLKQFCSGNINMLACLINLLGILSGRIRVCISHSMTCVNGVMLKFIVMALLRSIKLLLSNF